MQLGVSVGVNAASGSPWTPSRLGSSLTMWLRADLGVTTVGSAVTSWADQSGSGRSWTDGGSATRRPAYSATGFSNMPGITFDGSSDYLTVSSAFSFTASTTIALVATPSTAPTAYVLAGGGGPWGFISNFGGVWLEWFNGSGTDRKNFSVATSSTKFTAVVTQTDGASLVGRLNGSQAFSVVPGAALSGRAFDTIGAVGASNFANSTFAEIIVCNTVLAAGEIANLESYLRGRYNHY